MKVYEEPAEQAEDLFDFYSVPPRARSTKRDIALALWLG